MKRILKKCLFSAAITLSSFQLFAEMIPVDWKSESEMYFLIVEETGVEWLSLSEMNNRSPVSIVVKTESTTYVEHASVPVDKSHTRPVSSNAIDNRHLLVLNRNQLGRSSIFENKRRSRSVLFSKVPYYGSATYNYNASTIFALYGGIKVGGNNELSGNVLVSGSSDVKSVSVFDIENKNDTGSVAKNDSFSGDVASYSDVSPVLSTLLLSDGENITGAELNAESEISSVNVVSEPIGVILFGGALLGMGLFRYKDDAYKKRKCHQEA